MCGRGRGGERPHPYQSINTLRPFVTFFHEAFSILTFPKITIHIHVSTDGETLAILSHCTEAEEGNERIHTVKTESEAQL